MSNAQAGNAQSLGLMTIKEPAIHTSRRGTSTCKQVLDQLLEIQSKPRGQAMVSYALVKPVDRIFYLHFWKNIQSSMAS